MDDYRQYEEFVLAFLLCLPRLVMIMTLIPWLGRSTLPGLVRNGVVISLVGILVPTVVGDLPQDNLWGAWLIGIIVKEALIGLLMGFVFAIVFHAVEAVGFYIDNQRGSTMASSIDPLLGGTTSPMGLFLTQAFVVFFLVTGGFLAMIGVVYASFEVLPILSFMPSLPAEGAMFALQQVQRLAYLTFVLALPVSAAMFIAEISIALVSRFAPQMNVFVIAMPVKSAMAFLALILYIRILIDQFEVEAFGFSGLFQRLVEVL